MLVIGAGTRVLLTRSPLRESPEYSANENEYQTNIAIREKFDSIRLKFERNTPFDLHALSTPPAFILSQDQTLCKNSA